MQQSQPFVIISCHILQSRTAAQGQPDSIALMIEKANAPKTRALPSFSGPCLQKSSAGAREILGQTAQERSLECGRKFSPFLWKLTRKVIFRGGLGVVAKLHHLMHLRQIKSSLGGVRPDTTREQENKQGHCS